MLLTQWRGGQSHDSPIKVIRVDNREPRACETQRGAGENPYRQKALIIGLSDDEYRLMLRELAGCESSADLIAEECSRVIDAMKQRLLGPPLGSRPSAAVEPQLNLIKSLWTNLALRGVVRDASEKALTRFARRITKVDALGWLSATDANKVIGALQSMLERAKSR